MVNWCICDGFIGMGCIIDIGKEDLGFFFFFDEDNVEMFIKVFNGCLVNNYYWVFFVVMIDVEFEFMIMDM